MMTKLTMGKGMLWAFGDFSDFAVAEFVFGIVVPGQETNDRREGTHSDDDETEDGEHGDTLAGVS